MKNRYTKILKHPLFIGLIALFVISCIIVAAQIVHKISINMEKAAQPEDSPTWYPPYPKLSPKAANDKTIQRGEYLVKMGDCIACHTNTAEKGQPFAGGLMMQTPFGKLYSPNITPDPETGIGGWTDDQFIKAMREGISPKGEYYYPAFPYLYFSRMPVEDIKAIKAYLDAIQPVKKTNHDNEMVWPFSMRLMQLPWRILFFHPNPKAMLSSYPAGLKNPQAIGEYIVEGPGHCGMCHTPSWQILTDKLPLGAPIKKYNLSGAKVQGYLAPNINQANLGNTSIDEIVKVFTEDRLIGGGNVVGPMLEVNHDSLRYLSIEDLSGVGAYLKSVKSDSPPKPTGANAGKGLYENYCSGCHTSGAGGAPRFGDAAAWAPYLKAGMPAVYDNAVKGINGMPAKGTCVSCSVTEVQQAVDYLVAPVLGKTSQVAALPPQVKKLTPQDGKRIYAENCSVCHDNGFKNAPKPGDIAGFRASIQAGFLATYRNVVTGKNGHPVHGACPTCSDDQLIAALKYMLNQSAPNKNYDLW